MGVCYHYFFVIHAVSRRDYRESTDLFAVDGRSYVPVRVRQFAKAAKLMGKSFEEYAAASDVKADEADERQLVATWINKRSAAVASEGVA